MNDVAILLPPNKELRGALSRAGDIIGGRGLDVVMMDIHSWSPRVESKVTVGLGGYKPATTRGRITGAIMDLQTHRGHRHVVIDRGYINNRNNYWSVGWDGLNGRSGFCNANSDDKRIQEWGVELEPWREAGRNVLFCLQIPWDAAVHNTHYPRYMVRAINEIRAKTARDIVVREHPRVNSGKCAALDLNIAYREALRNVLQVPGVRLSTQSLDDDFRDAWCVVTYNSNSSVDATLQGIPSFVADEGSMTWGISRRDFEIEQPVRKDRYQWLCDISYAQWTTDEVGAVLPFEQIGLV